MYAMTSSRDKLLHLSNANKKELNVQRPKEFLDHSKQKRAVVEEKKQREEGQQSISKPSKENEEQSKEAANGPDNKKQEESIKENANPLVVDQTSSAAKSQPSLDISVIQDQTLKPGSSNASTQSKQEENKMEEQQLLRQLNVYQEQKQKQHDAQLETTKKEQQQQHNHIQEEHVKKADAKAQPTENAQKGALPPPSTELFFQGYGIAAGHAEDEFGGLGLIGVFEESNAASSLDSSCRLNMLAIVSVFMMFYFFKRQK